MPSRTAASPSTPATTAASPGCAISRGEELEEARRARRRRGASRARAPPDRRPARLDRAHLELEPVAEALDAAEHAHGVALREAPVEQLDVVPDARLDPAARVDELEREVRRAALRPRAAACARPRRRPRRRGPRRARRSRSRGESRPAGVALGRWPTSARSAPSATRRPGRSEVTAPPYDVIDAGRARELRARDPHNVVHLTLRAGRGRRRPALRRLARRRRARPRRGAGGLVARAGLRRPGRRRAATRRASSPRSASSRTRPARRPAARAHARGPEGGPAAPAARDAHAARADLPALRRRPPLAAPDGEPDLDVEGTRLWRLRRRTAVAGGVRAAAQLLIADGHHRYETALAFAARTGRSARMLVVLVSTARSGARDLPDAPASSRARPDIDPAGRGRSRPSRRRSPRSRGADDALRRDPRPRRVDRLVARRAGRARRRARRPARPRRDLVHARSRRRRSRGSSRARPTARSSSAPTRSRTSSSGRGAARRCRRSRRTSSRSSSRGLLFHPVRPVNDWLELCRAASPTSTPCSPTCRPAPSASPCSAPARAATTRPRSTRPPRTRSSGGSRRSARDLTLVSEELGVRAFGAGGAGASSSTRSTARVNAKRGIPFFSLSVAVADGPDDGRRRLRLRLRLRRGRGVDRRARPAARSSTARRSTRPARRSAIEILSLEGRRPTAIASTRRPRCAASPTGCA